MIRGGGFSRFIACIVFAFLFVCGLCAEETFVVVNGLTNEKVVEWGPHLSEQVTPACSFNIVLSLIGYDAKILRDENTPIWDFQEGYDDFSQFWKSSQTPQSWMTRSCVWYSKMIGLKLGLQRFQSYLALLNYGNQNLSAGLVMPGVENPAWVSSSLAISPIEQVNFLQKMVNEKLPVSQMAVQMTKALLLKEELSKDVRLYGKTGLGTLLKEDNHPLKVRWFVGWIETASSFFPFAYQLRAEEIDIDQTVFRVKQLLIEAGIVALALGSLD